MYIHQGIAAYGISRKSLVRMEKKLFVCIVVLFGCFFDIWVFFFVAVCVAALFKSLNRSTMINFKVGVEI